ncbi:putative surface protein with fasciclin (FAS1) repeats [Mariniflexile fucanivorans]|uniref:Putative surface protein with fasciclin (FAS1) repeats n=1 Tax=Mariniflexile fucanivorans TaxID=264023 RepID=A0A4V2QEF6_9FLAO|nr:fasciclin domain-containing protein [Mariniflexile fucanivorans]TCL67877.1 putative surface protein with fasciclin (FAS1) repeats [Mariniflexile fucanivorans]
MRTNKLFTWLSAFVLIVVVTLGCEDKLEDSTYFTSNDMTIIQTLESNPETFSSYIEILKKAEFYNAFKSYGKYTCFVPTNEAVKAYIKEKFNAESVNEITNPEDIEFLKILVKFHTIPTSRGTSSFIEGRLPDTTYTGDFITTSFLKGGGISNLEINRQVGLEQYDISAANGLIHTLNGVLDPYVDPVPVAMDKAGKHTIFVEALKQTGYYEKFSAIYNEFGSKNNFTILAESDEVYAQEGINSFQDLVNRLSPNDSNFSNLQNDLNRYVAYHATLSFLYSRNFPDDAFVKTILERNAWKSLKTDKELKLNETETGVNDTWTSLIMDNSNFPAKNGVYHTVNKLFTIFTPRPKYIIFDPITSQPEYQSGLVKSGKYYPSTAYTGIRWYPEANLRFLKSSKNPSHDYVTFSMASLQYYEFDTPVLPKGKYEVTVCGNGGNSARGVYQVYWDGEPLGAVWDARKKANSVGYPDESIMEANGWRPGLKELVNKDGISAYESQTFIRCILTKELLLSEQKSHVLRVTAIKQGAIGLDYFEFTPIQ